MAVITPPKYVISVLEALMRGGFEAYMVGGCVRDRLMGRRPNDWDVCTNALPEQVQGLFGRTHPTGLRHGTITVVSSGHPIEVTTYRSDGKYTDHRRPENVEFVGSLTEDLRRRDFTMNAIAMSSKNELCDPFGGRADIESRLIRCVGAPQERFNEDALRMLRALRFSAVLGFDIEQETYAAAKKLAPLTGALAAERISSELEKALCSQRPQIAGDMLHLGLLCRILGESRPEIDLSPLASLPRAAELRFAGLGAIMLREGVIGDVGDFFRALKLDGATIKNASGGAQAALDGAPKTAADWKSLSLRIGDGGCLCAAAAARVLGETGSLAAWRRLVRADECRSVGQLAVSGADLLELGLCGTKLGRVQKQLLERVIEQPSLNSRQTLLKLAAELID